jgi:hypothetical protein
VGKIKLATEKRFKAKRFWFFSFKAFKKSKTKTKKTKLKIKNSKPATKY